MTASLWVFSSAILTCIVIACVLLMLLVKAGTRNDILTRNLRSSESRRGLLEEELKALNPKRERAKVPDSRKPSATNTDYLIEEEEYA